MSSRGFSTVEMLVVIAVLALLVGVTVPKVANFYQRWTLDGAAHDLTSALRLAQSKSVQGEGDAVWSVRIVSGAGGEFTLFEGSNFGARDTAFDETYTLPSFLTVSETISGQDVIFTRTEGSSATTGTITISWPDGGLSRGVTINTLGTVDAF